MHTPSVMAVLICICDVVFNYLFIYILKLGVVGAALGTAMAYVCISLPNLYIAGFKNKILNLRQDHVRFRWVRSYVHNACKISIPIAIQNILMSGAQIVSTMIVAPLGNIAIAAHSFAITAESLCYMPGYGIGDAATTLVGQTHGAGRVGLCKNFAYMTVGLGMAVMAVMGVVDDYSLSAIQELLGALVAVFFLKKTDRLGLLRRRGSGFFNGILVGMFPFAMICYTLYGKLLFGMPTDRPLRTGWQIAWYFIGMFTVGVAEEFLFRGVIAQTLLEHFGTSRAGIWKACLLSGLFFGGAHLTNILSSAPFGVLMQCVFAGSLGVLFAAIYFRTGNLWVLVFLHGAQDAASLLAGGLYGTENMSTAVSSYDSTMLLSVLVYLIPTFFLLRKKKIGEVGLYFGKDIQ